jgi:hypothetical protein
MKSRIGICMKVSAGQHEEPHMKSIIRICMKVGSGSAATEPMLKKPVELQERGKV